MSLLSLPTELLADIVAHLDEDDFADFRYSGQLNHLAKVSRLFSALVNERISRHLALWMKYCLCEWRPREDFDPPDGIEPSEAIPGEPTRSVVVGLVGDERDRRPRDLAPLKQLALQSLDAVFSICTNLRSICFCGFPAEATHDLIHQLSLNGRDLHVKKLVIHELYDHEEQLGVARLLDALERLPHLTTLSIISTICPLTGDPRLCTTSASHLSLRSLIVGRSAISALAALARPFTESLERLQLGDHGAINYSNNDPRPDLSCLPLLGNLRTIVVVGSGLEPGWFSADRLSPLSGCARLHKVELINYDGDHLPRARLANSVDLCCLPQSLRYIDLSEFPCHPQQLKRFLESRVAPRGCVIHPRTRDWSEGQHEEWARILDSRPIAERMEVTADEPESESEDTTLVLDPFSNDSD